jgi:hypothetical protein
MFDSSLDYYRASDGLSHDEFRKFLKLRKKYRSKGTAHGIDEMRFLIDSLETIAECRANEIEDLRNSELRYAVMVRIQELYES